MMVQVCQGINERTILLQTVVEDLIVVIARVVEKMQKVIQILGANHYRSCCKKNCCISLTHDYFCTLVSLSLAVTHLMSFITENETKMEVILR